MDFANWINLVPSASGLFGPVSIQQRDGRTVVVVDRGDDGEIVIQIPPFVTGVPSPTDDAPPTDDSPPTDDAPEVENENNEPAKPGLSPVAWAAIGLLALWAIRSR